MKTTKTNGSQVDLLSVQEESLVSTTCATHHKFEALECSQCLEEHTFVSLKETPFDEKLELELLEVCVDLDTQGKPKKGAESESIPYYWLFLALVAHTGWGIYPVLARYLQTVKLIPSFSLLVAANVCVSVMSAAIVVKRKKCMIILKFSILPLLIFVTIIRTTTNLVSPKFTLAIYAQLMTLFTPFVVALLNTLFFKEPLPPFTIPSIIFSSIGSFMMFLSRVFPFQLSISAMDWIGIGLAFGSAVTLAIYMMLISSMKSIMNQNSVKGEELLFFLTFPVVLCSLLLSLMIMEDWRPWLRLDVFGWFTFGTLALFCVMIGNLLQIGAITKLGAPLVSTLLPFRLISSMVFSAVVLGEQLANAFQLLGALVVCISITLFLWKQNQTKK